MISIAITACNESVELNNLLEYLSEKKLSDTYKIVVQIDKENHTDEVIAACVNRGVKHYFFPLNKDFASYKNEIKNHCYEEYIFQVDADEIPSETLLKLLPKVLSRYPDVDVYLVPRINTVSGITEEHIQRWGWKIKGNRINFPDYQSRIYKNKPEIKWINKVHERLDGFKTYCFLPAEDEWCLIHPKIIERQEKQNNFYNLVFP